MVDITPEDYAKLQLSTLMDDEFMKIFFEDNLSAVEFVLRIIMNKKDLIVKSAKGQQFLRGNEGFHSVRLDVYAIDSEGRHYDIEIQNASSGASAYRARYNSTMIDANILRAKEDYSVLKDRENVVIFITATDVLKGNLPIYTIERTITQTGKSFGDGTYIIYVNASIQDTTTELGKLMHDFTCPNTSEMCYAMLAEQVKAVKKGDKAMSVWKDMRDDERAKGRAEGFAEGETKGVLKASKDIALKLLRAGIMTLDEVAEYCTLPLEYVKSLYASIKN